MNITIGEIINIILPYTSELSTTLHGSFPCISAAITNASSIAKIFLYVKQTSENTYAAAIIDDTYSGNRLIPTDLTDIPFVKEKHFLSHITDPIECQQNIASTKFKIWFYKMLFCYNIIRFNPADWSKRFSDLGFNSMKIRRTIDRSFRSLKCTKGDILELITAVNVHHNTFNLLNLEDKEIRCVYAKLKNLGLETTIVDNKIVHIEYEKRS